MRQTLLVVAALSYWPVLPVFGQQTTLPPLRFGTHVAGNMMNGPFDMYRVGGQLVIPVGPRLALYPAVSRFLDGAEWEFSAALRIRPFGARDGFSPFYLGVGYAGIGWRTHAVGYDLWITGLELPHRRVSPFVELQFIGPVRQLMEHHDWGVQAYTGLTWAVR